MKTLLTVHAGGLVLGAVTMALALHLIGALALPALRQIAVPLAIAASIVLIGWAISAVGGRGIPVPQRSWQVPEQWRYSLPAVVTLGLYGYLLGLGWLTFMLVPTYWLLVAGTLVVASLPVAVAAWLAFALGRFLTTRRGMRLVSAGSADIAPHNLRLTRTAAGGLLTFTAMVLSVQVL